MRDSWYFRIAGGALILLGFWVMISGEVVLPTRSPQRPFRFAGLSLWLLAASPALIGAVFWHMAAQPDGRDQPLLRLLIGMGMVLLGLAFVLSGTR